MFAFLFFKESMEISSIFTGLFCGFFARNEMIAVNPPPRKINPRIMDDQFVAEEFEEGGTDGVEGVLILL